MLQNDTPGPSGYQAPACLTPPAPDSYDIAGPFSALPDQEPHPPSAPPKTPKKRKRDAPKNGKKPKATMTSLKAFIWIYYPT